MKVLAADDEPVNLLLLKRFLAKWDYEVVVARDGAEAWNILQQEDAPRLAILDWMMPHMDGPQLCREVRKRSDNPYVYILLLTAKFQSEDIVMGLEAGADDFLTKPFNANELRARLRTGRRILELQGQLQSAYDQVKFQAAHDSLTGLLSRGAIMETLQTELARARREGATVGILLADLDHFKLVNDTYGHVAGDMVLREAASRMHSSVRPYDSIGRYGGEEFLIIMPGCDIATTAHRADCLRAAVGKSPASTPEGEIPITISLGVTAGGGAAIPDLESILRAADLALYEAKNGGRNRVAISPECRERVPGDPRESGAEKTLVEDYQL